jgi:TolB protein
MFWQRNNQRMDIYDINSSRIIDTLPQEPGVFSAPAWSPVDDRLLFGSLNRENQSTDLVISANGEATTLAPQLDGVIYFSWSPDGDKVAYTSQQGPLVIVDAVTGETIARSTVSGVLAFFWSPDSEHIAYITLATPPDSINAKRMADRESLSQETPGIAWSVMDVEDTTTRRYGSFIPTREMVYLLVYFDQFSQSHRVWSPDSRYLLYSETMENDRPSVNILDTTQSNIVPFSIAEGFIGVWSFS